jgi:hypothetical protein
MRYSVQRPARNSRFRYATRRRSPTRKEKTLSKLGLALSTADRCIRMLNTEVTTPRERGAKLAEAVFSIFICEFTAVFEQY